MGKESVSLVLGLDIGGTSTRALLADAAGRRLGSGRAGGANPTSHTPDEAAAQLRLALGAALDGHDPWRVRAGVIGLAGIGKLSADTRAREAFDAAWRGAGLRCGYTLRGDALVAYASATSVPDGTVLIAGTGAIAAAVRAMRLRQVADGHGWLLGDFGSGFWLGREAARAALAVLDGATADGPLARAVRTALLGDASPSRVPATDARETASMLVQTVNARPPVALAELAPLVFAAYDHDPVARDLVSTAAGHLVATVALVHEPGSPIVLAGGMLTADTPLAAAVRDRIDARWPTPAPLTAGDGAAAAAWLAARDLPEVEDRAGLHATLVLAAAPVK